MALIAACRSRQVVGVLAGRSGAVMAGVATADGYSTVVECCWCPSRGAMALIAARRGRPVTGGLAGRGGAVMAGVAPARRKAAVIDIDRCPRCGSLALVAGYQIGDATVSTPVTTAYIVCR